MKLHYIPLFLCFLLCLQAPEGFSQSQKAKDNFSYAFGMLIGKNLSEQLGLEYKQLDLKEMTQSLVATLGGKKTDEDIMKAQMEIQETAQALIAAKTSGEPITTIEKSVSTNFGIFFGSALKQQGFLTTAFNIKDFSKAMKATMTNAKTKITNEVAEEVVNAKTQELQEVQATENLAIGTKYLEEIAKKPGIQKTESGVYYEVLTAGDGATPDPESLVTVHYHGTLMDGKVFDSSVERGETIQFGVNQVIQGWQDVLVLMPLGSKWRVHIPANLAYGEMGSPGGIPPNATLIFEIELFDFE